MEMSCCIYLIQNLNKELKPRSPGQKVKKTVIILWQNKFVNIQRSQDLKKSV